MPEPVSDASGSHPDHTNRQGLTMAVTITDHNGTPLTLDKAVSGNADTHHPDTLARIATDAYWYSRHTGRDTVVHWHERSRQWHWGVAEDTHR